MVKKVVIGGLSQAVKHKKAPKKATKKAPPRKKTPKKASSTPLPYPGAMPTDPVKRMRRQEQISANRAKDEWKKSTNLRDIANTPEFSDFKPIDFSAINWERRMACKADPLLDLQTYMPKVFYMGFADYHISLIREIEDRIRYGGKKAFGVPRGGGKTAIARGMIRRATAYGYRKFPFFIGSKEDKAIQTLEFIKAYWYRSQALKQDFPEIAYPIYRIEGRPTQGMHGQTYKGERTHLIYTSKEIQYPSMLFEEEDIKDYLKYDRECVTYLPDIGIEIERFIINSAGCIIRVAGIDGSIRGEADVHPILLTQPRPDMILLDDVQKDQKADSPKSCEDLEHLIESAIEHLSGPDITSAVLMPTTVIREGDVADTYLTPAKKPDYAGVRYGVISKYPAGIDDDVIHEEINSTPNIQGQLWNQYREIRDQSFREFGDLRLANEFYREKREVLDAGFEVTWADRYKHDTKDPTKDEVSAIQSAMNWRFKDHLAFLSEGQNRPKMKSATVGLLLTPSEIAEKTTNISRNELSVQWTNLVAFIDIQEEILFYAIFAHDHAFNGQFIDYGTFPQVQTNYIRKNQTYGWSLLTREFYKTYPNQRPELNSPGKSTKTRAPFDEKIYLALTQCCSWLLNRKFPIQGQELEEKSIRALGIDTKWGKSAEVCKRFIREFNDQRIIAYQGHPFLPSQKQLEEYKPTDGWLFEHEQFPNVQESKWVIKPYSETRNARYVLSDVNRLKTFLMKRLGTSYGSQGCVTLFNDLPANHQMFADHLGGSEYPEPILARGITKDCWNVRPNMKDENDYLDCATGCMCLASICGASIKTPDYDDQLRIQQQHSLRKIWENKKKEQR
jgi:hypothetical protein